MKIFAINNKNIKQTIGYFFYYEKNNDYYIELCKGVDYWDMPFILDHFSELEKWTVNQYYTRMFIIQRIIPSDRQNIGTILKDNGLTEYDEIKLFLLADGRCAQDECYIKRISENELPEEIKSRRMHIIISSTMLKPGEYLLQFKDGSMGIFSVESAPDIARFYAYYKNLVLSKSGIGIGLGQHPEISYEEAYHHTQHFNIDQDTLMSAFMGQIMTTQDVIDFMGCTRQNINDFVKRDKLHPLNINARVQLFDKREVFDLL